LKILKNDCEVIRLKYDQQKSKIEETSREEETKLELQEINSDSTS
jgi:hypothetical protein